MNREYVNADDLPLSVALADCDLYEDKPKAVAIVRPVVGSDWFEASTRIAGFTFSVGAPTMIEAKSKLRRLVAEQHFFDVELPSA